MTALNMRVKLLRGLPEPGYAHRGDSGIDLRAWFGDATKLLAEHRDLKIPTGLVLEIPEGYEGQVRPRSGITDLGIFTHFATIDSSYRGEVHVVLRGGEHWRWIGRGQRIAQLVIAPVMRAVLEVVGEDVTLTETTRGTQGFGSTGLR